jgi:integrase
MTPQHRTLRLLGGRGERVRVYLEGHLVRVRWRVNGVRKHQSWPDTPENRAEAKAFAQGVLDQLRHPEGPPKPRLTLRELWDKYSEAEFPALRPKSQDRYLERWTKWERFLGRGFIAEDATQENVDQYRTARVELGIAINQVAEEVKMVKMVYGWGQRRRLINRNDIALYRFKIAKEDRRESPAEYRMADFTRILPRFNPKVWGQWRPWALLTLLGYQGVRTNAARHLQWPDVDLEEGFLTWRARWDKLGKEWRQPLREPTRAALLVAREWRERSHYHGPWVFFSEDERKLRREEQEPIYGHQALAAALTKAEKAAGVPHIELRAMHGLRRMVLGEVIRITGDPVAAALFIGDTDLRVISKSYLKRRDDEQKAIANRLDAGLEPRKDNPTATVKEEEGANVLRGKEPLVGFEPTTAPLSDPGHQPAFPASPSVTPPGLAADPASEAGKNHPEKTTELQSGGAS